MQTTVRLVARSDVGYGEEVLVCGSAPSLGSWKVDSAAELTWEEGGLWAAEVALPCGVRVEFKVIVRQQGGALRWLGVGPAQANNIVLETSLGRGGAQCSRFVGNDVLPFGLEVCDVEGSEGAPSTLAGGGSAPVAAPASAVPTLELAVPGAAAPPGTVPWMMTPQQQEAAAAVMLAGAAANAGHAVTYTTTTTTTTAVTINGSGWDGVAAAMRGQPTILGPGGGGHGGGHGPGGGHGGNVPTPCGGCALPAPHVDGAAPQPQGASRSGDDGGKIEATQATPEQRQAFCEARAKNGGIPRFGPVALNWPSACSGSPEPKQVAVRGSWDAWARDLYLEPGPGGSWRLLMVLPPGEYEFKFIVDGVWTTSDELERTKCSNRNNIVEANDMALAPTVPLALTAPGPDAAEEFAIVLVD
mmetsp:Transcript_93250/g.237227  ORF Transcript_93250/g.237227 Transcript_93250/m.237227 type:complete len:415 (-) Transcript_93250:31-1275(-)